MHEYLPLLIVGAIIGSFALVFILAYIALQKSKEKFDDNKRHMPDGEIIKRLLIYGKPYWKTESGDFWTMCPFIAGSVTYERADTPAHRPHSRHHQRPL